MHKISKSHGLKNRWFGSNLSKITRPVAAIKSLRFALFNFKWKLTEIVPYYLFDNMTALVQIMASHQTGNRPLSETILICFTEAYMHYSHSTSYGHGCDQKLRFHCQLSIQSIYPLSISHQSTLLFLRYGNFKIWPWKVKVMGVVNGRGHTVGPASTQFTFSFHINQTTHLYFKFWLWN